MLYSRADKFPLSLKVPLQQIRATRDNFKLQGGLEYA
jgi:hypothetical protein